jgi:hypothetical protein
MDNALDACEGVGTAPSISITLSDSQIIVSDNGPGMPRDTVKNLCDFSNRTSSNAAYISPARGAQGNALQTILAMARVQSDEPGVTIIEAHDIAHTITFDVDLVSDVPEIDHRLTKSDVHSGTPITVELASSLTPDEYVRFVQMARAYTWANPHLTLAFKSDLESFTIEASNLGWTKWTPADLTSALWYNVEQLKTLAASCVEKDRRDGHVPRHVSQFITDEFMGFKRSDSRAPVLDGCDGHHQTLETFLRKKLLGNLLSAAQKASKTYNAKSFGIIGKSHLQAKFSASVGTDTRFNHKLSSDLVVDGKPYLIEVAFGYAKAQPEERQIITCVHTTERYTFRTQPVTHILGLRLEDVERYDLAPESFSLGKSDPDKVKDTMRRHGATEEEIEFIVDGLERVELNGLTSPQMIEMIERKLKELGIKKLVPQTADLTEAWRLFERGERIKGVVEEAIKGMGEETPVEPPKGLLKAVKAYLKANPAAPWDEAVAAIAKADK